MHDFETDRLSVVDWRPSLKVPQQRAALEAELTTILTPNVLEHLPAALQLVKGAPIANWVDARAQESDIYLVTQKQPISLIGLLILAKTEPGEQMHFGYLLSEASWGKGFATELIAGFVSAMQLHAPIRLLGGVGLNNIGSARVLEKNGFVIDQDLSTSDTTMYVLDLAHSR